jgi:RHS repeat-associated protein
MNVRSMVRHVSLSFTKDSFISGTIRKECFPHYILPTGELIADNKEEILEIAWRVDSKIAEITRTPGSTKLNLKFQYDALGNRVAKHTFSASGNWRNSEFYVRDASGNLSSSYCLRQRTIRDANPDRNVSGMATYKHYPQAQEMHYQLSERHIYGSARIGTENSCLELIANSTEIDIREFSRTINLKSYEIANHLGNVISTVSDLKIPVDISNDNFTDSYSAIIISATDYSPFGAALESRSFNKEMYRFGFNGQESDDEINGIGNSYAFEYRVHDSRLGRFLSIDPVQKEYPWNSTYAFAENRVIDGMDLEGREWSCTTETDKTTGATVTKLSVHLKVVNSSTILAEAQIPDLMSDVGNQLDCVFSQMDIKTNTQYVISMTYEIVKEEDVNSEKDFVVHLKNNPPASEGRVKLGESTLGQTQHQSIDIYCGIAGAPSSISIIARTILHELGHTVGLQHPHQDKKIPLCANKYNSPNIENKEDCPDVFMQYGMCMSYLKSPNPKAIQPDMSILENFMMQSAAIDVLMEYYGQKTRKKSIDISSDHSYTGATIDQCKQAASKIESQDKD